MFLATISHELKTPLASSDIGLGLLERRHSAELDGEARGIIADLRKDHQRLVRIVSELLDMAQMETGRFTPKLSLVPIEEVVSRAIDAVGTQSRVKGVQLISGSTADLPPVVADSDKLVLVLINLLSNALRYSPTGGAVAVSARLTDDKLQLMVEDAGPGVDAGMEQRIFEPYSTGGSGRSSGLGLAISRQFMRSMGGDLELDGSHAQGARFVISCRLADGSAGT
jgi:signal transduction histidine kinase